MLTFDFEKCRRVRKVNGSNVEIKLEQVLRIQ